MDSDEDEYITFTVSTLNTHQLPIRAGGKKNTSRAKRLVQLIKDLEETPDIIAFQEVFKRKSRKIICKGLKDIYKYQCFDRRCGKYLIGTNSGLGILSKTPIQFAGIHTFKNHKGIENLSMKGVMVAQIVCNSSEELQTSEDRLIYVGTTHMQTGTSGLKKKHKYLADFFECIDRGKPTTDEIKLDQINKSYKMLQSFENDDLEQDSERPIILLGDFNIRDTSKLYVNMIQDLAPLVDTFNKNESHTHTSVWSKDRRIDYIMTNLKGNSIITNYIPDTVSDHKLCVGAIQMFL